MRALDWNFQVRSKFHRFHAGSHPLSLSLSLSLSDCKLLEGTETTYGMDIRAVDETALPAGETVSRHAQ